jgi:hypothetical protein
MTPLTSQRSFSLETATGTVSPCSYMEQTRFDPGHEFSLKFQFLQALLVIKFTAKMRRDKTMIYERRK